MAGGIREDCIKLSLSERGDRVFYEFDVPLLLVDGFETVQAMELLGDYGIQRYESQAMKKFPRGDGFSVTLSEPDERATGITLECKILGRERKVKIIVGLKKGDKGNADAMQHEDDSRVYAAGVCGEILRRLKNYERMPD